MYILLYTFANKPINKINMTITIEVIGNKKEIEKYFGAKIYSKGWQANVEKTMSKKMKAEVDLLGMTSEISICFNDEEIRLKIIFENCEIKKPK